MANISEQKITMLWNKTRRSDWDSLRLGLKEMYDEHYLDTTMYTNLQWAIDKLEQMGINFPATASELQNRLNAYL